MKKPSIRWQLTLWYSGVLAVVLAAFGAAIYVLMRRHLLERVDAGLDEELSDVLSEVRPAGRRDEMLVWLDRRFSRHEGFDFQVTMLDGERIFHNPRLADRTLPIPDLTTVDEAVYTTTARTDGARQRVVSIRVSGTEGELIVQVARSLEAFDHELGELLAALLITGPATLGVALLGGYFLARRALAPVDRMTKTAARVSARRLDERLEVANPNDELGRLAQTLNAMIERLENSFRQMQRFTADASHELRTPVAIIRTEAEVALGKPLDDKEKQELLSDILEECLRLTWITDQLLTLSREEAGLLQPVNESVDVSSLVERVVDMMRPLSEIRRQTLTCRTCGKIAVLGDPTRLRQVFYNLIDNAIKYTADGGTIHVAAEANGQSVVVRVRDNGTGIPPEHLPRVFDRFYRVDKARSRAGGGSGLGLSIVKSIVTAHGGRVDVDSKAGEGSTFTVALPAQSHRRPQDHPSS